jgi:hypothetical protein
MSVRQAPHPFPTRLSVQVNSDLREAGITDSNARFIVRRLIADAYAEGFDDGQANASWDAVADRQAKEDAT